MKTMQKQCGLATESLTVVKDLVQMHMDRNRDDETTDFCLLHLEMTHAQFT